MEINSFSSFFEFLGGLNIGYVAINYFKKDFSDKVIKVNKKIAEKLDFQISRIDAQLSEDSNLSEKDKSLLIRLKQRANVYKDLDKTELKHRFFIELFEPAFLLIGFYCLLTLLIGGFQSENLEIIKVRNLDNSFVIFTFLLGVFCAVFSFSVFFGSFSKRILTNKVKLSLLQTVMVFAFFVSISFVVSFFLPNFISSKLFLLTIIVLPSVLYALLTYCIIREIEKYNKRKVVEIFEGVFNLCKENFKHVFLYLILLIVFIIPVFLYCLDSVNHIYPLYLVILTIPFMLYILIAIRVYLHRDKFQKAYNIKAQTISDGLDLIFPDEDNS